MNILLDLSRVSRHVLEFQHALKFIRKRASRRRWAC